MPMTVLMPRPMPPAVMEAIAEAFPSVVRLWEAPDPEALLAEKAREIRAVAAAPHLSVDAQLMGSLPRLEFVGYLGVGYDTVDVAYAAAHGITVSNTPGVLDNEVADTTMALILNTVRRLPEAERYLRAGRWLDAPFPLTASLQGRTVGILGLGRIGKAIARRCEAFGLTVVYHGRRPQAGVPYLYYSSLVAMAEACSILVVVAPGGAETRHIIDAAVLKALGPDGYLINMARGSLVDEAALVVALEAGTIAGAGLDVFDEEPTVSQALIDAKTAVLLPHVGSASFDTRRAMGQLVVDNLCAWAAGHGPLTPVPETPWPR